MESHCRAREPEISDAVIYIPLSLAVASSIDNRVRTPTRFPVTRSTSTSTICACISVSVCISFDIESAGPGVCYRCSSSFHPAPHTATAITFRPSPSSRQHAANRDRDRTCSELFCYLSVGTVQHLPSDLLELVYEIDDDGLLTERCRGS